MKVTFRCLPELEGIAPEPRAARGALPDWLPDLTGVMTRDGASDQATVEHCPPFAEAMACGFLMPLACDVRVADGRVSWLWHDFPTVSARRAPRSPMAFQSTEPAAGLPGHGEDMILVRFMAFWTIELPPGHGLLVTHPFNRDDLPFRTLSGLVTPETCADTYLHVPAVWTDRGYSGLLAQGTTVAQCIPVPLSAADVVCEVVAEEPSSTLNAALHDLPPTETGEWHFPSSG